MKKYRMIKPDVVFLGEMREISFYFIDEEDNNFSIMSVSRDDPYLSVLGIDETREHIIEMLWDYHLVYGEDAIISLLGEDEYEMILEGIDAGLQPESLLNIWHSFRYS